MKGSWYHGSPLQLTHLLKGSTITRDRHLAEVFSHKPTVVSIDDNGAILHNGTVAGYLYQIAEQMGPEDVYPHPNSSMAQGKEWLTSRDLRLELIGPTTMRAEERLTEEMLVTLRAAFHKNAVLCCGTTKLGREPGS